MSGWLKARITAILPDIDEYGFTDSQTVVLELPDGKVLYATDDKMICEPQLVDSVRDVLLFGRACKIGKLDQPVFNITPEAECHGLHPCMISGRVEDTPKYINAYQLNIGYGRVRAEALKFKDTINEGDYIIMLIREFLLVAVTEDGSTAVQDQFSTF